jgi:hypothetical protein
MSLAFEELMRVRGRAALALAFWGAVSSLVLGQAKASAVEVQLQGATSVAGYRNAVVFSAYDPKSGRYALEMADAHGQRPLGPFGSRVPFAAAVGPTITRGGGDAVVYSRCARPPSVWDVSTTLSLLSEWSTAERCSLASVAGTRSRAVPTISGSVVLPALGGGSLGYFRLSRGPLEFWVQSLRHPRARRLLWRGKRADLPVGSAMSNSSVALVFFRPTMGFVVLLARREDGRGTQVAASGFAVLEGGPLPHTPGGAFATLFSPTFADGELLWISMRVALSSTTPIAPTIEEYDLAPPAKNPHFGDAWIETTGIAFAFGQLQVASATQATATTPGGCFPQPFGYQQFFANPWGCQISTSR